MTCSFGATPSALVVTPENQLIIGTPAATVMDNLPAKNIPPFGMCRTQSNPAVAAATAAASGVPTPAPCVPVTPTPWKPGSSSMLIAGKAALHDGCKCDCKWGGVIQFTTPGQVTTEVA